jgi:guanylate kinase
MGSETPHIGKLIVLSGPSGSGKSTVVARTLASGDLPIRLAVSATTRQPRPGEVDGVHYHFRTPAEFDQAVRAGEFLEWAEVYGHRYGTLRSEVDPYLRRGLCVLLEIDTQGAQAVRRLRPDSLMVFLRTSSLAEYERRLRQRSTEDEASLQRRVESARHELDCASAYDSVIINDDLDEAVRAFRAVVQRAGGCGCAG